MGLVDFLCVLVKKSAPFIEKLFVYIHISFDRVIYVWCLPVVTQERWKATGTHASRGANASTTLPRICKGQDTVTSYPALDS